MTPTLNNDTNHSQLAGHQQEKRPGFEQVSSPLIRAGTQRDTAPSHVSSPEINVHFDIRAGSTAPASADPAALPRQETTVSEITPAVSAATLLSGQRPQSLATTGSNEGRASFCTTQADMDHKLGGASHMTENNKSLDGHTTVSPSERPDLGTSTNTAVTYQTEVVASSMSTMASNCPSFGTKPGSPCEDDRQASTSTVAPVTANTTLSNCAQVQGCPPTSACGIDRAHEKDPAGAVSLSPSLRDGLHSANDMQLAQDNAVAAVPARPAGINYHRLSRGTTLGSQPPVPEEGASEDPILTSSDIGKPTSNAPESPTDSTTSVPASKPPSCLSMGDGARVAQASGSPDLHKRGVSKLEGGRTQSNTGQVSRLGSGSGGVKPASDAAPSQSSAISSAQVCFKTKICVEICVEISASPWEAWFPSDKS